MGQNGASARQIKLLLFAIEKVVPVDIAKDLAYTLVRFLFIQTIIG
jgi:hypothetical protein